MTRDADKIRSLCASIKTDAHNLHSRLIRLKALLEHEDNQAKTSVSNRDFEVYSTIIKGIGTIEMVIDESGILDAENLQTGDLQ